MGFEQTLIIRDTYFSVTNHAVQLKLTVAELDAMPRAMTEDKAAGLLGPFQIRRLHGHTVKASPQSQAQLCYRGEELPWGPSAPRCYWPESVINATGEYLDKHSRNFGPASDQIHELSSLLMLATALHVNLHVSWGNRYPHEWELDMIENTGLRAWQRKSHPEVADRHC